MKYRHRLLILLFLFAMLTFLDRVCISVAGPAIQKDLALDPKKWGWVVGMFALAYAAFEIPSGWLGDRIGPRKVLTRIVLWWSVFTAATGAVFGYSQLLLCRFAFGVGEAGAFPNASVAIARWFPAAERARAQGAIWTATRLGATLSPVLVVPIQARYGWRASFWIFGAIGVFWALVWWLWFRDLPSQKAGISRGELEEIGADASIGRRATVPWRMALRSLSIQGILAMYFCYCYSAYFFISWLHTYLVKGRGFTPAELAIFSPLPFLCGAFSNALGGIASDHLARRWGLKWGRRCIGVAGLTGSALCMFFAAFSTGKMEAITLLTMAYACSDLMLPSAWAVCLDVGKRYAGSITGMMNTAGQIGSFLSSVTFGYFVSAFHSYDLPLIPIGFMLLVSASQWLRIDPTQELPAERAES